MKRKATLNGGILKKLIFPLLIYIAGVSVFAVINYNRCKSILLQGIDRNLFIAAQSVKNVLTPDFHDNVTGPSSVNPVTDWENIRLLTTLANNIKINFVYTIVIKNGKAYFTSCSTTASELENHSEAHYWFEYPEASAELLNMERTKEIVYETTDDRWGTFRSVLVPALSPKGNFYVVGADYEISYINKVLWKEILISLAIALFLSLLVLPMAFAMLKIEKQYSKLLQAKIQERTKQLTREITERKRTEQHLNESLLKTEELAEKAQSASIAKNEFLNTMSHEIRTPLNVIVGMSSLLSGTAPTEEQKDYIRTIKDSSDHLLNLIDGILDFSMLETKQVEIENVSFDLREITRYAINSFMNLAKHKSISLESTVDDNIPKLIKGDPGYLRQILFNLVGNAVKFTETGQVRLEVFFKRIIPETRQIELDFRVSDTGIGIPDNHKQHIFDKFRQGDGSYTRKYGGAGMGLAISRHLISLLKGKLWFESAQDVGTTFYFSLVFDLPTLEESEFSKTPGGQQEYAEQSVKLPELDILLAEDNKLNVKVVKSYLEKSGHRIDVALNGLEVIDKLKLNKYDIVLMDIEMPEMDGIAATKKIREGFEGFSDTKLPVIALTAHALSEIKDKSTAAGMNHFITKPIDFNKLNILMANVLREAGRLKSNL